MKGRGFAGAGKKNRSRKAGMGDRAKGDVVTWRKARSEIRCIDATGFRSADGPVCHAHTSTADKPLMSVDLGHTTDAPASDRASWSDRR